MGAVRLGKISLRWCTNCNVPIIELKQCGRCGKDTVAITITPPGDYRPAFKYDIERIRRTLDSQFGEGTGKLLIPENRLVVLNKCPAVDTMDEVIVDGLVTGSHAFEPVTGWRFICRLEGAHRIHNRVTKNWVKVDDGAIPFIRKGASTMAVGVLDADLEIKIGDEVMVLSESGAPVSTGRSRMTGREMISAERNAAVKSRWYKEVVIPERPEGGQTWDMAVEANAPELDKRIAWAKNHILKTVGRYEKLPVAVSYSGGKDSLATLLLVLDAGLTPKLLFMDTGLEFPETLENVARTAETFGLELLVEEAGDAFWNAEKYFGPPAKDFRWCCKTCKLGPTASMIRQHFPHGVLSFIGQRQYESRQRYEKGDIWRNPWVPGQVGASPIQRWPSMLVWLYLFRKKAEYNPLYEKGLERIGCWLCPAADLAEFETIDEHSDDSGKWLGILEDYASAHGLPKEWVELGLWRWKWLPKGMIDFLEKNGIDIPREISTTSPTEGLTAEQKERVERFFCISDNEHAITMKALHCVGCGICISGCEADALRIVELRVEVDPERCNGCGKCLHPCVVVDFPPRN